MIFWSVYGGPGRWALGMCITQPGSALWVSCCVDCFWGKQASGPGTDSSISWSQLLGLGWDVRVSNRAGNEVTQLWRCQPWALSFNNLSCSVPRKVLFFFQNPDQMDPFKPSLTQADLDIPLTSSHGSHHPIIRLCICMFISLLLVSSLWTQILLLLVCPPMSVCSLSKAWCVGNNQKVCVDWLNEWMFLLGSKWSIKERAGTWVPLPVSSSTN